MGVVAQCEIILQPHHRTGGVISTNNITESARIPCSVRVSGVTMCAHVFSVFFNRNGFFCIFRVRFH